MSDLPKSVIFREEGPREGFQIEKQLYPLAQRVELVEALADAKLTQVQVGSFVKAVPSMADIEQLFAGVTPREDARYTALWLNEGGFRRAQATPNVKLSAYLMLYTKNALSQRNTNCSTAEQRERQRRWVSLYQEAALPIKSAYVVTAFGCSYEGNLPLSVLLDAVKFVADLGRLMHAGRLKRSAVH